MQKILLFFILFLSAGFHSILAQTARTGKVLDEDSKEPLIGATIQIKGTSTGVVTDAEGNFSITTEDNAVILISYTGFLTQEVAVNGQISLNILLKTEGKMDEVVIVGYGTQTRQEITGSTAGVNAEDIKNLPVATFESALQGRAAGVQVESGSGKLGQGIKIRVRGSASVTAGNQPLYVVDGILITSDAQNTSGEDLNPLADLNTNDIESIEVLKDASAAAIYGARASNGVVLITTKRGKAGKTLFDVNYSFGSSTPTRKRGFMNSTEYVDYIKQAGLNAGFTAQETQDEMDANIPDWRNYTKVNENWEDQAFQRGGFQQLDLSSRGGNEKTRFYVNLSYLDQAGILKNNALQRISGRVNLDHQATEKLTLGMSMNLTRTAHKRAASDNEFSNLLQGVAMPSFQPAYNADGSANQSTLYYNPLLEITDAKQTAKIFRNLSNFYASYKIIPELVFRTEFGLDILHQAEENYNGSKTARNTGAPNGVGYYATATIVNYTWTNTLTYSKTFAEKHNIEALAGMSLQKSSEETSNVEGRNFPSNSFQKIASAGTISAGSSAASDYSFVSYFGRVNYKYNNRYLFSVTGRMDGSSRFGNNSRYGFFPSVSGGWIISEEDFMKNQKVITNLKVRASYGLVGNAQIGNFDARGLYGVNNYAGTPGVLPTVLTNPSLKWETTAQWDLGLEIGLIKDRFNITVDYYNKDTRDLLLNVQVPATSGFTTQTQNLGRLNNKGIEFSFVSNNLVGDFKWTTSFNISRNINTIKDLNGQIIAPGNSSRIVNQAREGEPIGVMYGVKYAGVDPDNGDALYYDAQGNKTKTFSQGAIQKIGNPNPKFFGGLTNTLSYKGFDMTIFLQFVSGNDVYNTAGGFMSANGDYFDNQTSDQLNSWKQKGDITDVPQARLYDGNGVRMSSRYVYDASYMRLKTFTVGYSLPKEILDKAKLRSVRVYFTAQNLLTFTKYKGWDPEVSTLYTSSSTQNGNIIAGADFYTPPQAKTLVFGISLGL